MSVSEALLYASNMTMAASKMIKRSNTMKPEEYVRMLAEAPRDKWIAMSEDESRIVGVGDTMEEAVSNAQEHGVADPVLTLTPSEWAPIVLSEV
jgi:hypothetical protein